jgi:proline iminopeptidase
MTKPYAPSFVPPAARTTRAIGGRPLPNILDIPWQRRWAGVAVGAGVAALSGLLGALAMPRGPVTTGQALALLVGGVAVGALAGLATRTRWAMLLAPIAHLVAFEIGRLGATGPTVDAPRFEGIYSILALVVGRGFHGLVGLLPIAIGAVYGAALARRQSPGTARGGGRRFGFYARRATAVLMTAGLIGLAGLLAWPASTPPLVGPDGKPLAGSVAELAKVRLGGHDQWIMIRAQSAEKPVLLYLSGGPGQSDLPFSRVLYDDLTRDFVVVGWDQRGTGKSYPALDPATLTLDRMVADTIELTDYLRVRFDESKIYLLGESWGSTLGVLAAQRRPDLYHAVIGSGQMVSQRETDRRLYADILALAERTGDADLAARMRAYGEPPYGDVYASAFVMQQYDRLYQPYTLPQSYVDRGTAAGLGPWGILGSEYTLVEKVNLFRGLLDMFSVMYPQLQGIDFRRDVPRLEVPLYMLDGQSELTARRDLALEWYAQVEAPRKRLFSFENAAHSVSFEQFEAFGRIMTETVLPETYPGR